LKAAEKAVDDQMKAFGELVREVDESVMKAFGDATFEQLKSEAADMEVKLFAEIFNVFASAVKTWISENVANKVVLVSDTTKSLIKTKVTAGEEAGESIDKIAARIDELYLDQIIPNRSTVIARTEVISASNAGNRFAAKQTGLNLRKEWISTRDEKTRDEHDAFNHKAMDEVIVDIDEPYQVPMKGGGTEPLMFPGDPKGSAANVIQCRCTEGYHVKK
jgi:uncharacterized protein with gpF-like domain